MAMKPEEKWMLFILEMAIADEKGAQEKYKYLAVNSKKKEIQELFMQLYEDEKMHEKALLNQFKEVKKRVAIRRAKRKQ